MKKEKFDISGMSCSACSSHVEKAVGKLDGIERVSVNLLTNSMQVEYDEDVLSEEKIVEAVVKAGYGACPVGGENGENPTALAAKTENNAVVKMADEESRKMKLRLIVSIIFWIPLMYVAMYHMFYDWFGIPIPDIVMKYFHGNENAVTFGFTQLLLLCPIMLVNKKYFTNGFKTLWHRAPNMDSLIAIGASAAVVYGIFAIYRIGYGLGHGQMDVVSHYSMDLYFESAGTILTLITVGKYLESKSKKKTSEAITKLMDLSPKTAIVIREGKEVEIPTEQLIAGDVFLVKPGSLVPADGRILEGTSSLDESAITGESIPVEKRAGDMVISATVNKNGSLTCEALKVGADTTLSQIIRLVEEASASKAPIAKMADKIAGIFVPTVIIIALAAALLWLIFGATPEFAMSIGIAVLVISCPCALGLATPVAIMVGTGVGAKNGILVKSGEALQEARNIDTIVLDKTGTITEGKPRVTDLYLLHPEYDEKQLLRLAASMESKSEHPLAEAIVTAAKEGAEGDLLENPVEITDFKAVFGRGIQAERKSDGKRLLAGNEAMMSENSIPIRAEEKELVDQLAEEGKTPLLIAAGEELLGIVAVADTVKPSSRAAIREFSRMGIHVIMLTGDNRRTAEAIRRQLGIEEVIAEVLPAQKEQKVSALRKAGRKVAMVGDGINDAPALAAADVGIAIGAGTDVAMESADIILMKSDLQDAATAVKLSRAVIRNIKENLFWAFFYNSIGIPLAAGILYPAFGLRLNPMFGAAAMSLSSVCVVANALRLRGFKAVGAKRKTESGKGGEMTEKEQREKAEHGVEENNGTLTADGKAEAVVKDYRNLYVKNAANDLQPSENKNQEETTMKKVLTVEGMMCAHCTGRVQKALEGIDGVDSVAMSLENKTAEVTLSKEVPDDVLKAAVTDAGYEVTGIA